jgi:hypothetical protein
MYVFCSWYDRNDINRNDDIIVKVLEYTHHKSSVPRARVHYKGKEGEFTFYMPRAKIVIPVHVYSSIDFYIKADGREYNIKGRAMFYRHPKNEIFISPATFYDILSLYCDEHLETPKELSKLLGMTTKKLNDILHKEFMNYADELPF